MAFRKPASKRVGLKVLVYGDKGSGKTIFSLSFPKIVAIDSENGMSWYEGTEDGKNLIAIDNTQSYQDLEDAIDDMEDGLAEELGAETFVLDSESKVYQNIQEAVMNVEERRAKKKGRDVMDTNLSVRSWGKIGQVSSKLQNMKIDMTSKGIHFVSVAQAAEIKEKQGDQMVVVGHKPAMDKKAPYDYDIVLFHYVEEQADGSTKFFARVEKDRSKVYKVGDIIENPSFENWKARVDGLKDKDLLDTNLSSNRKETEDKYEKEVEEEEKPLSERMKELAANADKETAAKIVEELKAAKITTFTGLTAKKQEKLEEIYQQFK